MFDANDLHGRVKWRHRTLSQRAREILASEKLVMVAPSRHPGTLFGQSALVLGGGPTHASLVEVLRTELSPHRFFWVPPPRSNDQFVKSPCLSRSVRDNAQIYR
jgi:hypothetical protein